MEAFSAFLKYIILSNLISETRDITQIERKTTTATIDEKKTGDTQIADFLQLIIFFCCPKITNQKYLGMFTNNDRQCWIIVFEWKREDEFGNFKSSSQIDQLIQY